MKLKFNIKSKENQGGAFGNPAGGEKGKLMTIEEIIKQNQNSMTIEEIKRAKWELVQLFAVEIDKFNRKTGVAVSSIDIRNVYRNDYARSFLSTVEIKLENL